MSDVKRYWLPIKRGGFDAYMVLASDYDALEQRCQELERVNDDAIGRNTFLETERDTLRADNERLRRALERISSRAETFVSACTGMSEDSTLVIAGIARSAIEETPCARTTGDTPAA